MARYKRGAKSQAIRDYLTHNPEAAPKEVIEALKGQKLKVTSQMVSTIRTKMTGKKVKRRKKRKGAPADMVSMETLLKAKKLIAEMGSLEMAREAIDALAKLQP